MDWIALLLTLKLALIVCLVLLALGLPIAYWVAFSRWRGKFLIEALVTLPLVLPPTVLGFYVLVALGPHSPLGQLWIAVFGHPLPFTFGGLVLASVLYSLPFMVQPVASAFAAVDPRLLAASSTLGVNALGTFRRLIFPLSFSGILTGLVLGAIGVFIVEREFAKAAAFAAAGAALSYFGFMHGEAVGIGGGLGVSPGPALAYAIVAIGLFAFGRRAVALPMASEPIAAAAE